MSKLHVDWLRSVSFNDKKKREDLEAVIRNSSVALSILRNLIEEKDIQTTSRIRKDFSFDNPVWAHKQAFELGKMSAYEEVLQLLGFLKETKQKE